jgi:hypothetical protein
MLLGFPEVRPRMPRNGTTDCGTRNAMAAPECTSPIDRVSRDVETSDFENDGRGQFGASMTLPAWSPLRIEARSVSFAYRCSPRPYFILLVVVCRARGKVGRLDASWVTTANTQMADHQIVWRRLPIGRFPSKTMRHIDALTEFDPEVVIPRFALARPRLVNQQAASVTIANVRKVKNKGRIKGPRLCCVDTLFRAEPAPAPADPRRPGEENPAALLACARRVRITGHRSSSLRCRAPGLLTQNGGLVLRELYHVERIA